MQARIQERGWKCSAKNEISKIAFRRLSGRRRSAYRPSKRLCRQATEKDEPEANKDEGEWKLPIAGSDTDWRTYRARLVAGESTEEASSSGRSEEESWAHAISQPERGCLILAHPLMFKSAQQYFDQAVILLISHDSGGTAGLILNKPLDQRIGSLQGAETLRPEFDKNTLFLGGDVGNTNGGNVLQLLHGQKQFARSVEIMNGIYIGGFEAARMAIRKDQLDPISTCRWYCQYSGWAPGQLQSEINSGVWFPAAASKDLVLHPTSYESGKQWHMIMKKIGGEYKQLSEALQPDPNVNYLQKMAEEEMKETEREERSEGDAES